MRPILAAFGGDLLARPRALGVLVRTVAEHCSTNSTTHYRTFSGTWTDPYNATASYTDTAFAIWPIGY